MANPGLRRMLERDEVFFAPAVWNPVTARLARHLGFKALYVPGSGTGIAVGESEPMTTLTQIITLAERALEGVGDELPMIVDVMCGFGNPNHVQLTVMSLEDAGVSAIHIQDQVYPSQVPFPGGGYQAVSIDKYQQRVEYAVKARKSRDFLIIARNDVNIASERGSNPRNDAVKRAHAALEVGADAIFISGMRPQSDDMEFYRSQVKDVPMVTVPWAGGKWYTNKKGELLSIDDYRSLGYQLILYERVIQPTLLAIRDVYKLVKDTGYLPEVPQEQVERIQALMWNLVGMEEKWEVEAATTESGHKSI